MEIRYNIRSTAIEMVWRSKWTKRVFLVVQVVFLIKCSAPREKEEVSNNLLEIEDFERFEEFSKEEDFEIIEYDESDFWSQFLEMDSRETDALKFFDPPNIAPIIEKELFIDSVQIDENFSKKKKKVIAEAICIDGKPTIIYYTKNRKIDKVGFAFFKMHEYSHFLLGHKSCSSTSFPNPENEFAADCKAVELLLDFDDGQRVVDAASGMLRALGFKKTSTHPSSVERANRIFGCFNSDGDIALLKRSFGRD
jgi:hypothetical protein